MGKKEITIVVVVVAVVGALFAWFSREDKKQSPSATQQEKVQVVASFYPLAHFAEQVGGDLVQVTNVTPPGTEPHEYEPTPKQVADLYTARLVLANGSGLDPWLTKIQKDLEARGVTVVELAQHIQLIEGADEHAEEQGHGDEAEHEADDKHQSDEVSYDPHFWLDPVLAQKEVAVIRDSLIALDGKNAAMYRKNADAYLGQLIQLDTAYRQGLAQCADRTVVTSHQVFGYLAKRYTLTEVAIAGISPEEEPSSQRMVEIASEARALSVTHIFFETLVSPKIAETIAREIGAQTLVFNPLEGLTKEELAQGKTYISVMQENLQNLRTALRCS